MSSNQEVKVTITGDSAGLLKALSSAGKATEDMAHGMESAVGGIASAMERFAAPLTAFLGVLGGGALFKEAVEKTAELGDELAKGAQKAGMSVEALSGLRHAAQLSDVAFEDLVGAMGKLSKNMQEAVFTPTSKAAAAFKALGVEVQDSSGHLRGTEEVLADVAEKFKGYADGTAKTALAMNIFGKSGAQLIPLLNEGRDGLEELTAEAKRLGITMTTDQAKAAEKYKDDLERVGTALDGVKVRIAQEVMPTLTRLAEWFTEKAPAMLSATTRFMQALGDVMGNTVVQITALATVLSFTLYPALLKAVVGVQTLMVQLALARMGGISAMSALGQMAGGLVSPWLLAAAAIAGVAYGLSTWAQSYGRAASEKAESDRQMAESSIQTSREFFDLSEKAKDLDGKLQSTAQGSKAHADALKGVNIVVGKMVEAYPEFLNYLHKENGEYVGLTGSIERFTKRKVELLQSQLEDERRKATEARNEAVDARGGGWSGIVGYALVYKGIADDATKEAAAHEGTAKALQKQLDALKGLASEQGKPSAPTLKPEDKTGKEADPYLAYEAQMKAEAEVRKERLALWDKHQADLAELMDGSLGKQVHEINTRYDEMLIRERAFGADEATLKAIELKRDQEIEQAKTDFAQKQADERKRIAEEEAKEARRILEETGTAQQGFLDGMDQYLKRQGSTFQQWANAAQQMFQGVESAISRSMTGLLTGQMSFGQAIKSLWQGMMSAVVGAVAQMVAKWLVMEAVGNALKKAQNVTDGSRTSASLTTAAAETWAAYSWIPFGGAALAEAQIQAMGASMAAAAAASTAMGAKVAAAAEGGWFDRPTLTMIGEGKRPELVVPDVAFKDFATNLASNILAQERQAQAYGRQAAGYARSAAAAGGSMPAGDTFHLSFPGAQILDTSDRGLEKLGNMVIDAVQVAARRRGQVLVPGSAGASF